MRFSHLAEMWVGTSVQVGQHVMRMLQPSIGAMVSHAMFSMAFPQRGVGCVLGGWV